LTLSHEAPVVIVGGGIAGSALGRACLSRGVPFRIVERQGEPPDGALAINLPGNAIQALSALGLRDQIEAAGHPLRRREYRSARDKLLFEVDEDAFWGPALRPRSIRRSALLAMLGQGLPDELLHYDTAVRSLELHPDHVELGLGDGRHWNASLVVGADGAHSRVRREAFGDQMGLGLAQIAPASWRFMTPNPGVDCWTVWAGPHGMVLLMPVSDEEVYGWAALTRPIRHADPVYALHRMSECFPLRVREALHHAIWRSKSLYHSPLEEVRLHHWYKGRALLIGDAAHATAPVWAQGAALALEDAIVLARLLAAHDDVLAVLPEFEDRRRARVAHVQAHTDAMSRATRLPSFIRDSLMPFIGPKRYRQAYGPLMAPI
jgi:2-polyprenyl-6-methoxyphenol hydroxylase-like FAD-dependent oxidoreductase